MEIEESEIASLRALAQTFLFRIEAIEKRMIKKPSKRALNKKARVDRQIARLMKVRFKQQ